MANYTLATLFPSTAAQIPYANTGKHYTLRQRVTIPSTYLTADTLEVIPVKAGTFVRTGQLVIVQAGGGTTFSGAIGDGTSTAGFVVATSLKATGQANTTTGDAYLLGKYYAAADTIDILLGISAASGTAIVDVILDCVDYSA